MKKVIEDFKKGKATLDDLSKAKIDWKPIFAPGRHLFPRIIGHIIEGEKIYGTSKTHERSSIRP